MSVAAPVPHTHRSTRPHFKRWQWLVGAVLVVVLGVSAFIAFYLDEVLRSRIEANVNRSLVGYSVRLPALDFHLFGFSITLRKLELIQQAHPEPPVALLDALKASVQWRALIHGRLVADFVFDRPKLHVNLIQLNAEAKEPKKVQDKGWQQAAEEIYPLKINHIEINDGDITYIDKDPKQPLHIQNINFDAENIRNVASRGETYPSPVHFDATIFGSGRVEMNGRADFLAEPYAAIDADIRLEKVLLRDMKPVAAHVNLKLDSGSMDAEGHVTYSPKKRDIRLKKLAIEKIAIEYVHRPETAEEESQRLAQVSATAKDISNEPATLVVAEQVDVRNSSFAYRDQTADPGYRVTLTETDITLRNLSNQATEKPATVKLEGKFLGDGKTTVVSSFRPVNKTPEFDLTLQIEPTKMTAMNDLLRSYGNFDVSQGTFSFYSEMRAHNGEVRGYVKPLFSDMKVYDSREDEDESTLHKLYERSVGAVAKLLENDEDDVATKADISGRVDNPNVRTWQVLVRILQNAFIRAIRPGLDRFRSNGGDEGD